MFDLKRETPIPPRVLADSVPGRRGRGVAVSTVMRWMLRGRRGVRLESAVIGGRRFTSREAFDRWIALLNAEQPGNSPSEHRDAIEKALLKNHL